VSCTGVGHLLVGDVSGIADIRRCCTVVAVEAVILSPPLPVPAAPVEADLLAKYFRILGDRTRLRVIELVAEGERSVGELVSLLGEPQSKVSNHLACLRSCGFVTTRREHRTIHYRLADQRIAAVVELGRGLLRDHAARVAACERVDAAAR
jgi:ArsR family transcriptional regulator, cadmium/lead-responsive transcriptional repressor